MKYVTFLPGLLLLCTFFHHSAAAITIGQIDTFEDGTTEGWVVGPTHPSPPENISSGGPGGDSDHYLQLTAIGGFGAGSRLSAFNLAQWTGNYVTTGVGSIQMDVRNFGPDDLYLRLLFADPLMGPPTNVALSANAVFLPAGSDWTSVIFPVAPGDLLAEMGTINNALTNARELRIFHNPNPSFAGPPISSPAVNAMIGVDNVSAAAADAVIPEPSTISLLAGGLMVLAVNRLKR